MKKNTFAWVVLTGLVLIIGCGKSGDPIAGSVSTSDQPTVPTQSSNSVAENRVVWGLWKISISADRTMVDISPDRAGAMHFNVVRLLEVSPCSDCLKISNVELLPDGELSADLTLTHPYPEFLSYTGFDLRGIFISGTGYTFPVSGKKIAWGDDHIRMLNPDGYTGLFNPTDFPETDPPILGYVPGHNAPGGDLSATLNPYVAYETNQPRRMFLPGTDSSRSVLLHIPDGPLEFGYAVDASWHPVDGDVNDPEDDFPPEANCPEAYAIVVQIGQGLSLSDGGMADILVEVFDHQGLNTIDNVAVEAPELFFGEVLLSYSHNTDSDSWVFAGTIANELGAVDGRYPLLVRVTDDYADPNLGRIDAWNVFNAKVGTGNGWARTWGASMFDNGNGVAVNSSGDIFVVGHFHTKPVDFDPGPGVEVHTPVDSRDVFLSKFNSAGLFQWVRTWGGHENDYGHGIAIDDMDYIYVIGSFRETVDFDPGPWSEEHSALDGEDAFLSKFDSDGTFHWVRTWGGESDNSAAGIALDHLGNMYVVGRFYETADFDPGPLTDLQTSEGHSDCYLSKFDSSGDHLWVATWGGTNHESALKTAIDSLGDVYVTGWFWDTVDFDPGSGTDYHSSNGGSDIYLSKLDSSGVFQWAHTWGGQTVFGFLGNGESGRGIDIDTSGSIYIAGNFSDTIDLDPGPEIEEHASLGEDDIFLSKFDPSGDFQWTRTWGGIEHDMANGLALCGSDGAYVVGTFSEIVDFDPGPGIDEHSVYGARDAFLARLNLSGNFLWARTWGGPDFEYLEDVVSDASENAYLTGSYKKTVDFDPGPGADYHISNGNADVYLCKFPSDGIW